MQGNSIFFLSYHVMELWLRDCYDVLVTRENYPGKEVKNEMDERVRKQILDRQKADHRPTVKECRPWRNTSGCLDPTAYMAITNVIKAEKKNSRRRKKYNYKMA